MAPPLPPFGDLLRRHRQAARLTQAELAEQASLSVDAINTLECGKRRHPRRDTVALLAEALHLAGDDRAALEAAARRSAGPSEQPEAGSVPPTLPAPTSSAEAAVATVGHYGDVARREEVLDVHPTSQAERPGASALPALPSGTITLLVTDIEGSTRLLQQLGDRYPVALATHRALLRAAFAAHGGHEVDTQGDAFFVAFASAANALVAAVEAQQAFANTDWPQGVAVRVRMGLHTGTPTLVGDLRVASDVLDRLALVAYYQRSPAQALALLDQSLALAQQSGDESLVGDTLCNRAYITYHRGYREAATAYAEESLAHARRVGDRHLETIDVMTLGEMARGRGDFATALTLVQQALHLDEEVGDPRLCAETIEYVARALAGMERGRQAARLLGAAAALRERVSFPQPPLEAADTAAAVGVARATVGEPAWATACAAGRELSTEQAIAEALGEESGPG